jgi:hypothetical protein
MTDRAKGFLVHLSDDMRIGDETTGADRIADAIRMLKGVTKVEPIINDAGDALNRERVRLELVTKLWDALS